MNQTDQMNQINQILPVSRAERLRIIAEADRKVEGAVYAAKQGVV